MSTPPPISRVVVLFDDGCGLCSGAVRWLAARDTRRALRFAPLSGETARPYLAETGAAAGDCETLVLVEGSSGGGERIFVRSAAVGRALRHAGGAWGLLGRLLGALPRGLADRLYCAVSRHRGRAAASADRPADPPWLRGRMLR